MHEFPETKSYNFEDDLHGKNDTKENIQLAEYFESLLVQFGMLIERQRYGVHHNYQNDQSVEDRAVHDDKVDLSELVVVISILSIKSNFGFDELLPETDLLLLPERRKAFFADEKIILLDQKLYQSNGQTDPLSIFVQLHVMTLPLLRFVEFFIFQEHYGDGQI